MEEGFQQEMAVDIDIDKRRPIADTTGLDDLWGIGLSVKNVRAFGHIATNDPLR